MTLLTDKIAGKTYRTYLKRCKLIMIRHGVEHYMDALGQTHYIVCGRAVHTAYGYDGDSLFESIAERKRITDMEIVIMPE